MKITTLIENRNSDYDPRLTGEWGLSLHIDFNGHSILFYAGLSGKLARNAGRLGIDIKSVDAAVLSHHHDDHGNGFKRFFEINPTVRVYLGPAPDGRCIYRPGFMPLVKKYAGLDRELTSNYASRFKTTNDPAEILPGVFVIPHISGSYPRPHGNKHIFIERDHQLQPDDFSHEVVMAIKDGGQLVIFTGCSHNGLLNMVDTAARLFSGMAIKAVIGGFHLVASPPFNTMAGSIGEVEDFARQVLNYPVEFIYTGHCTGSKAFPVLKGILGEHLHDMRTGTHIEL